jgi:hypothetical protein
MIESGGTVQRGHGPGRIAKHVTPLLGAKSIGDVSRDDLRGLVEHLDDTVRAGELHWNTAGKVWGLVTKLFDDACRGKVAALRVRDDNPARDVRGPDEGEPTAKQWLYPVGRRRVTSEPRKSSARPWVIRSLRCPPS